MTSSNWDRIEQLFHAALERPREDRAAWLARQTADEEVRREVNSLLASLQEQEDLPAGEKREAEPAQAIPAESFGPYQLVKLIGRGGMGAVYLAHRADGQFDQTVAVKLMAPHLAGPEFLARFQNERQLLATLNHPHITRLLDGGVTPSGTPYLVMEYVEGEPVDRYCDGRKLSVENRLGLFLQICEAADYAHRNLIVHRDLKPGNILVTGEGVVKLLDFGTAALAAESGDQTRTRVRLVTPRYASPERLRGERANPSNDVFSLGVILYELLTGAWPYGNPDSPIGELQRAMGDATPSAPSTVLTEEAAEHRAMPREKLARILEGDLSAIALKALEDEPARRYGSVRQLAEDVQRFLDGLPVVARPPTFAYRAGKFLRRRWLPVVAATIFVAGLAGATFYSVRQAAAVREEQRRASAVNQFLNNMLASAGELTFDPRTRTVEEMVDRAAGLLNGKFKDDPLTEASVRESLGQSYSALFDFEKSRDQFNSALRLIRSFGQESDEARILALLGVDASNAGRLEEANQLYQDSLHHLAHLGKRADVGVIFLDKRDIAANLITLNREKERAQGLLNEAIDLATRDKSIPRRDLADCQCQRGRIFANAGDNAAARADFAQSLRTGRELEPGGIWEGCPLAGLISLEAGIRNYKAAAEYSQHWYEVRLKNGGEDDAWTASSKLIWARYKARMGEVEQAVQMTRAAIPVVRKRFPPGSLNLVNPLDNASVVFLTAHLYPEAEAIQREWLQVVEQNHLPESDSRRANALWGLGDSLWSQHRQADGIRAMEHAEAIYRQLPAGKQNLEELDRQINRMRSQPKK